MTSSPAPAPEPGPEPSQPPAEPGPPPPPPQKAAPAGDRTGPAPAQETRPAAESLLPIEPQPARPAELIYAGSVSLWTGWRSFVWATLAAGAGGGLLILGTGLANDSTAKVVQISGGALLGAALLVVPLLIYSLRTLRYTITTALVEREEGIFVRRVDNLDLGRIRDVELCQNLIQRLLGIGSIELFSSDQTDPCMRIENIPGSRSVYERLRDAVIARARQRGIVTLD